MAPEIELSDDEWRSRLSPEQFRITRLAETEPAFSGAYWNLKDDGIYRCVGCGQALFSSATKYESGSGWPSYWEPIPGADIAEETDRSHGMVRTEASCGRCGAHLGHIFPDGPRPTGMRYCINSASLDFEQGGTDE